MAAMRRSTPLKTENIEPQMCTIHLRLEILRQVPFFAELSAADIAEVNELFHEEGYPGSETIYFAGDPARRLYVVAVGKVKLIRHTLSGQDVLLDILTPGEFFGSLSVLGDEEYPDTAQAQTKCCVVGIAAEAFQTILRRYPLVAVKTLDVVSQRLQAAHEMIRQLSTHSVERRIASVLLKLAEKLGEEQAEGLLIQTPLSRQELAEMTGTTTETASRVMSQLQKNGLIRTGRQWVAIADHDRLSAIATGDVDR
jgi:CRP-like cAMP-binding protein